MRPGGESGAFLTEPYAAEFETMQQFQGNSVWLDGAGAREAREARLASFAVGRKPDEEQRTAGDREAVAARLGSEYAFARQKIETRDAAHAKANPRLRSLRAHAARSRKQLEGALSVIASTSEHVKTGFRELRKGFQQARQWAREKIASLGLGETQIIRTRWSATGRIGLVLCTALLAALAGCIGTVDGPRSEGAFVQPSSVFGKGRARAKTEYVYYPGYQVYYNSRTRQFVYPEGRSWFSRPTPPQVPVEVLFASPSVKLDFHDHPSVHHSMVVRRYPKYWVSPASSTVAGTVAQN